MINSDVDDFLEHFGVKGMKWGQRKKRSSGRGSGTKTAYKKPAARLNDAELNRRIKRMELEKKYSDLNQSVTNPGRSYAKGIMSNQGKAVVGTIVGTTVGFMVNRALNQKFGGKGNGGNATKAFKNLKDNVSFS